KPSGEKTRFSYNTDGSLATHTDALDIMKLFTSPGDGNIRYELQYADGTTKDAYSYKDNFGRDVSEVTERNGQTTQYQFTPRTLQKQITYPNNSFSSYSFSADPRLGGAATYVSSANER